MYYKNRMMSKNLKPKTYLELEGYDSIERTVRARGSSGGVYLPKIWRGAQVSVIHTNESLIKKTSQRERRKEIPLTKKLYKVNGYEMITRTVRSHGQGATIPLPLEWVGRHVKVILLDNPLKEGEMNK
jgi:putative transposon-encoded protein